MMFNNDELVLNTILLMFNTILLMLNISSAKILILFCLVCLCLRNRILRSFRP